MAGGRILELMPVAGHPGMVRVWCTPLFPATGGLDQLEAGAAGAVLTLVPFLVCWTFDTCTV